MNQRDLMPAENHKIKNINGIRYVIPDMIYKSNSFLECKLYDFNLLIEK